MREATALEDAIGLLQLPSRARVLRDSELPKNLEPVLRIVGGDGQAVAEAARAAALPEGTVEQAASFYIEQILLHPGADSYRVLGAAPDATTDELRRNMALLLRWLHPDREANSSRTIYVGRVTEAWNNLKTAERRAAYDVRRKSAALGRSGSATSGTSMSEAVGRNGPPPAGPLGRSATARSRGRRRSLIKRPSIWRLLGRLLGSGRT
jgi:hypothetical protein